MAGCLGSVRPDGKRRRPRRISGLPSSARMGYLENTRRLAYEPAALAPTLWYRLAGHHTYEAVVAPRCWPPLR
jgi:hypothetical protein